MKDTDQTQPELVRCQFGFEIIFGRDQNDCAASSSRAFGREKIFSTLPPSPIRVLRFFIRFST